MERTMSKFPMFSLLRLLVIPLMRKQRLKLLNKVMPPELESKPVKVEKAQALSLHLNCLPGTLQPNIC